MAVAQSLDLLDPAFITDPYPALARLREESPVVWHEASGLWLVSSHEHVSVALRDRRFGRLWTDRAPFETFEPFNVLHRNQMMENEPPKHTTLRRLVSKAFARGHVERLRPRIAELAGALLDQVAADGAMDLIADYAEPLPVAVIAELLGVPESDRDLLRPWSQSIVRMYEYGRTPEVEAEAVQASVEFAAYMRELAAVRKADPKDDLVSHLASMEDGGDRLSEDEVVASAILLLNAGHEATVNGFGNGLVALFRNPDQLERLRKDPSLLELGIEEMFRYDTPSQLFERTAIEDVELGGQTIRAGEKVAVLLGAANRDPAVFDAPDTFDVGRTNNPHVTFGAGIHFCLGAPLARLEIQTSLPLLLERMPRLELADSPELRPTFVLRGYSRIPVTFETA
jgi:cytochrome P450